MRFQSELYESDIRYVSQLKLDWKVLEEKTILVTGATGMIGTFLIDVLMYRNIKYQNKISILALSRNKNKLEQTFKEYKDSKYVHLIEQDVTREFSYNKKIDYIIHAASNTHPIEYAKDPIGTITSNVLGTFNLLECAKKHSGCKMILLSSVEIYGENRGDIDKFDESYIGYINCNTLRAGYPESKRLAESMLQAYRTQEKVDSVSIRLCRTYGPTVAKDDSKAISQFIRCAVENHNIVLKSEGNQLYSYVYVADAVSAILYVMLYGKSGEAYNVADEKSDITLKNLAEILAHEAGTNVVFELPEENEKKGYSTATKAVLNAEKVKKLGWCAKYSINDGLVRTVKILQG